MVGKPLVEASMTGLNSILMAYGQTGAGRIHSAVFSFIVFEIESIEMIKVSLCIFRK